MSEFENHGEMPETTVAEASEQPEVNTTEPVEPEQSQPTEAEKRFSQEELDRQVQKRLARERRQWEREHSSKSVVQDADVELKPIEQYASPEDYAVDLAKKISKEMDLKRQQEIALQQYQNRADQFSEQFEDFEDVINDLRVTPIMAEVIRDDDLGPQIAYHLGKNKALADRIAKMSTKQQVMELGKIHLQLSSDQPFAQKVSKAPSPPPAVKRTGLSKPDYNTDDPRAVEAMDTSEWIRKERERQIKKLKGG